MVTATYKSEETCEVISTEDLISKVDDLNKRILDCDIDSDKIMVGSLDVKALYSSIDTKKASRICKERITKSPLTVEGIDYKWAGIYLAITMTPLEKAEAKVQGILPRRTFKGGTPPSVKTDQQENKWWFPKPVTLLTQQEKKNVLGCIAQQLVKLVFSTHFYLWDNKIFHQHGGCPNWSKKQLPHI